MASMTTRTVQFDEESEKALAQIRPATGLSISALLKQGLLGYHEEIMGTASARPYAIYQELDLGHFILKGGLSPCFLDHQAVKRAFELMERYADHPTWWYRMRLSG